MKRAPAKKSIGKKSIVFVPGPYVCEYTGSPSILEIAIAHDVPLNHSCGGMGSCTTCRVFVIEGGEKLGPRNEVEAEHAQMRGFAANERLSCQTLAEDGIKCQIPPDDSEK